MDSTAAYGSQVIDGPNGEDTLFLPGLTSPTESPWSAFTPSDGYLSVPAIDKPTIYDPSDPLAAPPFLEQGELVTPLLQADPSTRDQLGSRFGNWISHFGKRIADDVKRGFMSFEDGIKAIGNEVFKLVGGNELTQQVDRVKNDVLSSLQSDLNWAETEIGDLLQTLEDTAQSLGSPETAQKLQAAILQQLDAQGISAETLGTPRLTVGGAGSLLLQAGYKSPPVEIYGVPVKGGVRVSYGLARGSGYAGAESSNYAAAANTATDGVKLGFVGTLGTPKVGPFDVDMEISFNTTIKDGKVRLDSIQIDPVMDIDMRHRIQQWMTDGLEHLIRGGMPVAETAGDFQLAELPGAGSDAVSIGSSDLFVTATSLDSDIFETAQSDLEAFFGDEVAGELGSHDELGPAWEKLWSTLELSPLRFLITNGDINNPDVSQFRGGMQGPVGFGWVPGTKYLSGAGLRGEIGGTEFIRLAAVADINLAVGNESFMRAQGFQWDY